MNITQFIRIIIRQLHYLIAVPLLVIFLIYHFTKNLPKTFQSNVVIYASTKSQSSSVTGESVKMDFYTSGNLFDNITLIIKSRESVKETSLKLLSLHLSIDAPVDTIINTANFETLKTQISPELKRLLQVKNDPQATFEKVKIYYAQNPNSVIDYLIREDAHYSVNNILNNLKVNRKQSSDMVEVTYTANDAGICFFTLKYLTEVFSEKYRDLKRLDNESSISYFETQLKLSKEKLQASEAGLKEFISRNNILNYYEQGKNLDIIEKDQEKEQEKAKEKIAGTSKGIKSIETFFQQYELRQVIIDSLLNYQRQLKRKQDEVDGLVLTQGDGAAINKSKKELTYYENLIRLTTDKLFANTNTEKGAEKKSLLSEWLKLKIEYEDQSEAFKVMQGRKSEIQQKVNSFAPLGAELRKLEREVSINENQYLSILQGVNLAYLKKYDLDSFSSQTLLDPPFFPKDPQASKRAVLIIGGGMGSVFLLLVIFIAGFFLDRSIRSVARAESITGLKVTGGWSNVKLPRNVKTKELENELGIFFVNKLKPFFQEDGQLITVTSIQAKEGKTFILQQSTPQLQSINQPYTVFISEENHALTNTTENWQKYPYEKSCKNQQDLINSLQLKKENRCIFLELPALTGNVTLLKVARESKLLILIIDASRKWNASDKRYLEEIKENVHIPIVIFLNKMALEELEDLIGEIPKKRSWLRKKIKQLLS